MKKIIIFSFIWFILNLFQAYFTEIIDDEAYYWVFSRTLDWGYFDHPPMIALLIRAGTTLFPGELGVRFFPSLLGAGTVFIILFMLRDRVHDTGFLIVALFSVPLLHFHVAGPFALPDLALLFFVSLFFLLYRNYLEHDTPVNAILLGFAVALMLYSKYHALLVISLTLAANPGILRRKSSWGVALIALVLFLPHILWQVKQDFVSFRYHLIERNRCFQPIHILNYVISQLVLVGPFAGILLFYLAVWYRTRDPFDKVLKFNFVGGFFFFLLMSVRGHVEPHWTAVAFVPMLLLSAPLMIDNAKSRRWILILSLAGLPVIIICRLILFVEIPFLPEKINNRFFHKEEACKTIREAADGRPVVFTNSYQQASLYMFFTGDTAFSHNNKYYRKNQYDLMNLESGLQGRKVLYFPKPSFPGCDSLRVNGENIGVHQTDFFCFFNRVRVKWQDPERELHAGEEVEAVLLLENPTAKVIQFYDSCTFRPWLVHSWFSNNGDHVAYRAGYHSHLPELTPGDIMEFPVTFRIPDSPGKYRLMFSFGAKNIPAGINGRPYRVTVRDRSKMNSEKN